MSTHDLIAPHLPCAPPTADDDIVSLASSAGLTAFPYRNFHQDEQLAIDLARWPLLAELSRHRGPVA